MLCDAESVDITYYDYVFPPFSKPNGSNAAFANPKIMSMVAHARMPHFGISTRKETVYFSLKDSASALIRRTFRQMHKMRATEIDLVRTHPFL